MKNGLELLGRLVAAALSCPDAAGKVAILDAADTILGAARRDLMTPPALLIEHQSTAPAKGRRRKPTAKRKVKRKAVRKPAAPAPAPAEDPTTHNGVTIAGAEISFNGKSITVRPKEAAVARVLARIMPSLLPRVDLARQVWGRTDDMGVLLAGQTALTLGEAIDAIGLKITSGRGVGIGMAEA